MTMTGTVVPMMILALGEEDPGEVELDGSAGSNARLVDEFEELGDDDGVH